MADVQLLGLFHDITQASNTIQQLRDLGVPDERIEVMSGLPYRSEMLGRPRPRGKVTHFALIGALMGLALGFTLTAGLFLLYPLDAGGQPLVPVPPTLIILFEATMLGTMWATFFGLLMQNRFPNFKPQIYDPRITEGHIGIVAELDEGLVQRAEAILNANGAHHLQRAGARSRDDPRFRRFWWSVAGALVVLTILTLLPVYDVVKINIPTNMLNQDSIGYEQGPRLAAPAQAVPVQGPVVLDGQPASEPVPASADSLQRGKVLFGIDCALCHGADGSGNGPLADKFTPRPVDLHGSTVRGLSDADIFMVITQGYSPMPSIAENLTPNERWDVINYVRSLAPGGAKSPSK